MNKDEGQNNDQDFMHMSTQDADRDFIRMLENVEEIPLKMLEKWHRGDDNRIEIVSKELVDGDVNFCMKTDLSEQSPKNAKNNLWNVATKSTSGPPLVPLTGYQRVEKVKEYMSGRGLYWPYHFMVEVVSLKKWLNKTFPLESEHGQNDDPGTGNEKLIFAAECYKDIYPNGFKRTDEKTKKQYDRESDRITDYFKSDKIKKYLKENNVSGRAKDALIVQLNPVKK